MALSVNHIKAGGKGPSPCDKKKKKWCEESPFLRISPRLYLHIWRPPCVAKNHNRPGVTLLTDDGGCRADTSITRGQNWRLTPATVYGRRALCWAPTSGRECLLGHTWSLPGRRQGSDETQPARNKGGQVRNKPVDQVSTALSLPRQLLQHTLNSQEDVCSGKKRTFLFSIVTLLQG